MRWLRERYRFGRDADACLVVCDAKGSRVMRGGRPVMLPDVIAELRAARPDLVAAMPRGERRRQVMTAPAFHRPEGTGIRSEDKALSDRLTSEAKIGLGMKPGQRPSSKWLKSYRQLFPQRSQ